MNMARSAAKLFEKKLMYSNGEPVKVVICPYAGRDDGSAIMLSHLMIDGIDLLVIPSTIMHHGSLAIVRD